MSIRDNVKRVLSQIPGHVTVVAAAKTRTAEEISEAIQAGITHVGENYVQEAQRVKASISFRASWHFIGHLQTNKVKHAVSVFDMIQTVDSIRLAREVDKRAGKLGIKMPVLIEVNSAQEPQKAGIMPGELFSLLEALEGMEAVVLRGLMTMGPFEEDPERIRPYFRLTKELFENARDSYSSNNDPFVLSMGMSDSYRVAIEEGANMVRIGTALFGPRAVP